MADLALNGLEGYIQQRIEVDRITHRQLSEELKGRYPGVRGYSGFVATPLATPSGQLCSLVPQLRKSQMAHFASSLWSLCASGAQNE